MILCQPTQGPLLIGVVEGVVVRLAMVEQDRGNILPTNSVRLNVNFRARSAIKYGNWRKDLNPDGTLKPGVVSSDQPLIGNNANVESNNSPRKKAKDCTETQKNNGKMGAALVFTSALVPSPTLIANTSQPDAARFDVTGPLMDDGAPFSAIGEVQLKFLRPRLL